MPRELRQWEGASALCELSASPFPDLENRQEQGPSGPDLSRGRLPRTATVPEFKGSCYGASGGNDEMKYVFFVLEEINKVI